MAGKKKGVEVGVGYVSVTSDSSRVVDELFDELDEGIAKKGGPAGEKLGEELGKGASKQADSTLKKDLGAKLQVSGLAIGAAAAGVFALGFKRSMEESDLVGSIKAQLGVTTEEAAAIGKKAGEVYNQGWGESLSEVGNITATVEQQLSLVGGDTGMTEDITAQVIALSKTFGDETASITEKAAQLVKTGLVDSMTDGLDLIAAGYQSNSQLSEDWLDTVGEYGIIFKDLGIDGQTALGMLNQGLAGGARNADQVADAFKELAIRGKDMSKTSLEAFEVLGMDGAAMSKRFAAGGTEAASATQEVIDALNGLEDPVKKNEAAVGLFGTKAEDLGTALDGIDPSKLSGLDIGGTAAKAAEDARGFDEIINGITRTLVDAVENAIRPTLPILEQMVAAILPFLQWLAANPVVTTAILAIASAIGVVAAAQWAWNIAVAASPAVRILSTIITVLGVVTAGIVWMVQNWETAGEKIEGVINNILYWINTLLTKWNDLPFGDISLLGRVELGGTAPAPGAADGGTISRGGPVRIGEFGPETLYLPQGARVEPLPDDTGSGAGGGTVHLTVNNPLPEPTSRTIRSASQLVGAGLI